MKMRPVNWNIDGNKNIAMETDLIKLQHFCCRYLVKTRHYDYLSKQLIAKTACFIVII